MSDPREIREVLEAAEDAFSHAAGPPRFEPGVNNDPSATNGEVQLQKACRLLELAHRIDDVGDYYGAVLEHSFIAIEGTFQAYLLVVAGADDRELRNHSSPYELAVGQVPLTDETITTISNLYDSRRTSHYYGTTVTTEQQADSMRTLAQTIHDHVVAFDPDLERYCRCMDAHETDP